ncbi:TlpA family protein disulfide reductase [Orrella sp. NBD-18]|uniref:TlpA family protein disulfide reductase n=1 Tax=Sheuella amnicola TaxID=2707330 RepID=A0A6B2QVT1_9BURK|nr:TlpA disulfide reductase family protein [Sheuella amnicola]NDY82261.1 TlpA family protein disulfide reductase [Sheuella amnicola]HBI84066.1 thioredoxin [Alcaligenaceae bacterium]
MKKLFILALVIALGGGAFWFVSRPVKQAPEVTFSTLTGKQITTSELRGKVVLVKFWATSCVTCVAQMPNNVENFNKYKDQGFDVIAVAMQYDPANYVVNFVETRNIPFTVALDSRGVVAKAFGDVKLTPTAFLIGKDGQIIKRYVGDYDKAEFRATLEKALAS